MAQGQQAQTTDDEGYLKLFKRFGLSFSGSSDGVNFYADCPFSEKKNKFYVNKATGQWDSKSTGRVGNMYSFMSEYYDMCKSRTETSDLVELAKHRNLPIMAFYGQLAYNRLNDTYIIPTYNKEGKLTDLGTYNLKGKKGVMRAPFTKLGIGGIEKMDLNDEIPVYFCEGEWDTFALRWLHSIMKFESVVLCIPGANVFKDEWSPMFQGRHIHCCYDNDEPGRKGETRVAGMLRPRAKTVKFICWPDLAESGYDVRDFIIENVGGDPTYADTNDVKQAFTLLENMFVDKTAFERLNPPDVEVTPEIEATIPTFHELEKAYSKWLKINSYDPITVMFGTCFANMLPGDPVWTFLVAPPGGSKTELLMTLNKSAFVETVTTLTPAAMVSGFKWQQEDPSLLLKINDRLLSIKDFTSILTVNPAIRDEIFGMLRDIYDGYLEKYFFSGKKSYSSHFGILAGVTPAIDGYSTAMLGERFIKFRLDRSILAETEQERIKRVLMNINQENVMREEMQEIAARMLMKKIPNPLPTFQDEDTIKTITELARFTSRMRASVPRDKYTGEQITKPITEIGTRLSKQFMKLAIGVAVYLDHKYITHEELRIVRNVARDTCPDRTEEIVRQMWLNGPEKVVDIEWLSEAAGLSHATISKVCQDMMAAKIIERVKGMERVKSSYKLNEKLCKIIEESGVYSDLSPDELNTTQTVVRTGTKITIKVRRQ